MSLASQLRAGQMTGTPQPPRSTAPAVSRAAAQQLRKPQHQLKAATADAPAVSVDQTLNPLVASLSVSKTMALTDLARSMKESGIDVSAILFVKGFLQLSNCLLTPVVCAAAVYSCCVQLVVFALAWACSNINHTHACICQRSRQVPNVPGSAGRNTDSTLCAGELQKRKYCLQDSSQVSCFLMGTTPIAAGTSYIAVWRPAILAVNLYVYNLWQMRCCEL